MNVVSPEINNIIVIRCHDKITHNCVTGKRNRKKQMGWSKTAPLSQTSSNLVMGSTNQTKHYFIQDTFLCNDFYLCNEVQMN